MAFPRDNDSAIAGLPSKPGGDQASETEIAGSVLEPLRDILAGMMQKRREKWDRLLAVAYVEIQSTIGKAEAERVFSSDPFLTFVMEATLIACRNHDDEKLGALRNAVVRNASPGGPDEPLALMFLRMIDYLTPLHLAVVSVLSNPSGWMRQHGVADPRWPVGTAAKVIEYCVPALQGRGGLVEMIVRDLQGAGLAEQGFFLRMPVSETEILRSHTTDTGRLFVEFISPT